MAIATGVLKQVGFKKETTWGVAAGATAGSLLRRTSSSLALAKDTYQSGEIRPDLAISDYRHGARRVDGAIAGEISPGSYAPFFAAMCRRDFTAVTAITGQSITIAASGQLYTVTRGSGSWFTDGVKIGMVMTLSAGTFNANNLNKNMMIVGLTATVATVVPLNNYTLTPEGPISAATVTVPGKVTYMPTSAFTNDSFTFEHWFSDIAISHQYIGCRLNTAAITLPATGIGTCNFAFLGKDRTRGVAQYFTSPAAPSTTGVLAAINGVLQVNGTPIAVVTGLNFTADLNRDVGKVIGSNTTPDIFGGSMVVKGQFSAYFQDDTYQALFDNETESQLSVAMTVDSTANSNFMAFAIPRLKVGTSPINDTQTGLVQTFDFMGLLNGNGGAGTGTEKTTLWVQDSLAP